MSTYGYLLPVRGVVPEGGGPAGQATRIAEVVRLARAAEALGFDDLWVTDSVLHKPRPDPLVTLAAVAGATDAAGIGTAVYLPGLRHPVTVAQQTATLDAIAGGRLTLGVGVGADSARVEAEYRQLGVPFRERGRLLNEHLELLVKLWSGEEVTYAGRYFELEGANVGIQPCRRPPVWVATSGIDVREGLPTTMRDRIASHADGWLPRVITPAAYADGLAQIQRTVEAAGRDQTKVEPALFADVVVADSREAAIELERSFLVETYGKSPSMSDDAVEAVGAFGTPREVRARLREYEAAGVERFVLRFPLPNQREQVRRVAAVLR